MSSVYFRSIWNTNNLFIKNGAINTPSYNTIDQNNLIAEYGQILYNSTTNTVKFFSNTGVWSEIGSIPTNNLTIGNLNFNNNTISSTTGDIILYPNSTIVKITGTLNMQTNNIINVGTINTLALPTSTFVGINDSQVLTNKTINGSQLVNNSVSLAKMSTLTPNTIIGNNTGFSATPLALDVNNVRAMLFLNLVENISLSTWAGSIYLNTVAPGAISLTEMANLSANTIIGNNTGVSATPIALSVTNVKTMLGLDNNFTIGNLNFNNNTISSTTGDIILFPNSAIVKITGSLNMQTNNIINVGTINTFALPTSTFVGINDSQVLTNKTINGSQLVNNSVSLAKMSTLTPNTIIGNNTGVSATPIALSTSDVKTMLGLVNNVTFGDLNINNNIITTSSSNITGRADFITWDSEILSSILGHLRVIITAGGAASLDLINEIATIRVTGTMDMQTYNITNVGTINTFALPTSTFVGINDSQTLTNKTINGSQLVNNSVSLAKMSTLTANTIIGNNTGVSATPIALTIDEVKNMIGVVSSTVTLTGDVTGSGTGSFATTIASGVVSLAKMSTLIANSIIGNNTGVSATPIALNVSQVRSLLSVNLVENQSLSSWTGNNAIIRVGNVASGNLVDGFGTINCGAITSDSITAKTTNSNLTLNGNGTGIVNTNAPYIYIANNRIDTHTYIVLDGTTVTKDRYIACYQNGVHKLGFGLSTSSYFFIWDNVNARDLFQASILDGSIRFPTYTYNGMLKIVGGIVTVDTNFTTSTNTINCNNISSNTTTLLLNGVGSNFANVTTNNASFLVRSTVANQESFIGIDGPTTTNNRHIACYQNGIYRCSFGLSGIQYFYVSDTVAALELFRVNMGGGNNCIRFPTYSNNGILRIDSGVVTVDSTLSTSSSSISVNSGHVGTEIILNGTNSTSTRAILFQHSGARRIEMGLSGTTYFFIYDTNAARDVFRIPLGAANNNIRFPHYGNGTLSISGSGDTSGTLTSSSDRRLKKSEELLNPSNSLQKIMNLQPKKYIWKDDVDNRTNIGFIAQDVELEIPEAIDGKKYEYQFIRDGVSPGVDGTVRVDENGIPVLDYDKPRYRGLNQCAILSVLVSAFQELHNSINIKLSSIENRLTALETVINNS